MSNAIKKIVTASAFTVASASKASMSKTVIALACLLGAASAHASVFKVDFTASNFGRGIFSQMQPLQDPVNGSITFTAASIGSPVTAINGVDLSINGHVYNTGELSFGAYGDGYLFGATANGTGINRASTDDFYLILSSNVSIFSYSANGVFDTWVTRNVLASYAPADVSVVPEPGTSFLLGLGLIALAAWRRRAAK
jgi:hypothetical protein